MFANLYQSFIYFYAGRIDRVVMIVLGCWAGGCFMDWLMGKMTISSVVWSLLGQLGLSALALTLKLREQARDKSSHRNKQ